MSGPRKSTRKKRQTQLNFTPLPSSSPAASQYPGLVQRRAASVRYEDAITSPTKKRRIGGSTPMRSPFGLAASNGGSSLQSQKLQVRVSSPSTKAIQLPTPAASSQVEGEREPASDLEKKSPLPTNASKHKNLRKSMQPIAGINTKTRDDGRSSQSIASEEDDDDDMPVRSSKRNRQVPITLSTEDSAQSPTSQTPVTPTKKSRLFQRPTQAGSSPVESDSEAPTTRLRQRLSVSPRSNFATSAGTRKRARRSDARPENQTATIVISDESEDTSSDDVVVTPVRRRKTVDQDQDQDHSRDSKHEAKSESSDDLLGELDDLRDTGTPLRSTRTRDGAIPSERSKRQRKLEELRRRRAGIREESQEEDDLSYQDDPEEYDAIEEVDYSEPEPIHHAMRRGSNLDEYEEDFVDDEDDKVGVDLGVAGVPLEFTYHANKRPFEHFKAEIEWMVHNKLNPAFDRHDEIYQLAHRKLDNEVKGFVGSKFSSSVWGEDFTKALQALPDLDRVDVPTMFEHKCDACRRSGHPPKHKVIFSGKPYNRDSLEIIEHDEEEDDPEDSDEDGSGSTEEGPTFFLGRFCCANAEMAHALHHWRYALNQTVLTWLAAEGHLDPAKIVERDQLSQKKRQKATNNIVDGMEETGVMKLLYKQFKENLAAARDAKPERFSRGH